MLGIDRRPSQGREDSPRFRSSSSPSQIPLRTLYKIKPTDIRILAVMNLKRRPTYWVGRE